MKLTIFILTLFLSAEIYAQENTEDFCQCETDDSKIDIIPLPYIREADVMWSTTIWRDLDLRQKINQPYYYPLKESNGYMSLFEVMTKAALNGCMTAYKATAMSSSGEFSSPMTCQQMENLFAPQDSVWTFDLETEADKLVPSDVRIKPDQIFRYRIKEQWIFDKQHSRMKARTIGIAPMIEVRGEDGSFRGFKELFWIHYPESRKVLAQHPVYLRQNDNKSINYDDLFAKRYYDGFLVKESNVFDRNIREYAQGIDGLLEGERIEEKIRTMESDFWAY